MKSLQQTSKYISLILRHHPEVIGITLDDHGWADVKELVAGVNRTHPLDEKLLEEIVRTDSKQRYSYNEDHTRIRANQGHSIPVDVELERCSPPEALYHGTAERFTPSIEEQGILPQSRLYVHLSMDAAAARQVGARHGRPAVYLVLAGEMERDGFAFYRSANGIYLTRKVPVCYLKRI